MHGGLFFLFSYLFLFLKQSYISHKDYRSPSGLRHDQGTPPWILKRGGLESYGRILISSIGKTKRIVFLQNFEIKKKTDFWDFLIFSIVLRFFDVFFCFKKKDFLGFLRFFWILLRFFDIFLIFKIFLDFTGFFLDFRSFWDLFRFFELFWITFKVTKVTTKRYGGYYWTPKTA